RSATRSVVKKQENIAPGWKANKPDGIELDRLYKELQIHQAELEEQNRELREVQLRLEESRDRYADLYDFAPVGYVDLDGRGSIRGINLKGATMLGDARSRLLGMPFSRYVDPGDRGRFLDNLKKCRVSKRTETADIVLHPKAGPGFPAQLLSVVSADPGKGPAGFRTAITDLSERKLAEEALRESEERFRSLVNNAMIGFFIAQDGKIVFMNPEQERIFGPIPESMRLEEFANVHPEDLETFIGLCGEIDAPGYDRNPVELRICIRDRGRGNKGFRWVTCRSSRIFWRGREARLVNMLDVTKTRELERIALVQEKMAALGHVAAGIAHEIRNPLSGMNIYLSTLEERSGQLQRLEPEERERMDESIRHLKSASAKIASVIKRVMDFSKPIPPSLEPASVNQAIEEAVALSSVALRNRGVKVKISLSADLPKCNIDPNLISQVLLNLIANADQAMDGIKGSKRLDIGSSREGEWVLIRVSDSGPGVPPSMREKIFDPYYTTKPDGTGIGLSFSRRIVISHGGSITVGESRSGGAEFSIRIPIRPRSGKAGE
ncbi:MAG TPA: ATP-binding protein, partial [Candidatus Deferrimicrobiaceae bacterium]